MDLSGGNVVSRRRAAAVGGLLLLTAITYLGAIPAGFVYEDWNATGYSRATALEIQPLRVRSLTRASYALDRWIGGNQPWAYHVDNVVLHGINAVLVLTLAIELGGTLAVGILAGVIFVIHPMNSEAVYYIAGRTELLSTGLILIAIIECLRQRWTGMIAAFALAVMAKESAVIGAAVLALVGSSQYCFSLRRPSRKEWMLAGIGAAIVAGITVSVFRHEYYPAMRSVLGITDYARLQATALWTFLGMILLPLPRFFTVDHDFEIIWIGWQALALSLLMVSGMILAALWRFRDRIWRQSSGLPEWILLGLLCAGVSLAPRFVMRIPEVLNEHQMMLPMTWISLVLAQVMLSLWTYFSTSAFERLSHTADSRQPVQQVETAQDKTQSLWAWGSGNVNRWRPSTDYRQPLVHASFCGVLCGTAHLGRSITAHRPQLFHQRGGLSYPVEVDDLALSLRVDGGDVCAVSPGLAKQADSETRLIGARDSFIKYNIESFAIGSVLGRLARQPSISSHSLSWRIS